MSYSFTVKAASADEAGVLVEAELGKVVESQPSHAADRQAAQDAAEAFIGILADPREGECIVVNMSGSLGWRDHPDVFTHANVSVSAYIAQKD